MPDSNAAFCTAWCASVSSEKDLLFTPFSTAMIWLSFVIDLSSRSLPTVEDTAHESHSVNVSACRRSGSVPGVASVRDRHRPMAEVFGSALLGIKLGRLQEVGQSEMEPVPV